MAIVTLGIDLAKNVFAVHGVDATGRAALVRPSVARAKLLELVASLPPCLIGMEACSGAHHWARLFAEHGHQVRPMAPRFVTPYRMAGKAGKNDAADAAAICEAVHRPNMRRQAHRGGRLRRRRQRGENCTGGDKCAKNRLHVWGSPVPPGGRMAGEFAPRLRFVPAR